ncbi:Centrin-3 [Smittium culicis]|uniref:Centrin-3 n=1 Tax=Smittium culicis TaxID=133412 RepID=A0A1R1YI07_9FUNG|nr:Centrin-3 [Smittium culicis]
MQQSYNMNGNNSYNQSNRNPNFEVSSEHMAEIKEAFELFDADNDGLLDYYEFKVAMRALGFDVKKQETLELLKHYEPQSGKSINLSNFMSLMARKISERNPEEEYRKAFRLFDNKGTGTITAECLGRVAKELGESLTQEEIKSMIEEFDFDGDGAINENEFIGIMTGNFKN